MDRLKTLRAARNFTQQDLATMLRTTQQTVARWESGKATPSISALRDLATIFSTSVDDLLGINPFSEKIVTNAYYILRSDSDGFWGHLGLLQPGASKTTWYPITQGTRERIWRNLNDDDDDWLIITTLNNRMLALRSTFMKRIWLLDDACDEPKDDWDWKHLWDDYSGLPMEVYRAMSEWAWEQLGASNDFAENNSETLQKIALETIEEAELLNKPEDVLSAIHHTLIRLRSGEVYSYEAEPEALWETVQDVELGTSKMLYVPASGGDFESYFPSSEVALLDMPLIDVESAARPEQKYHERSA